MRKVPILSYSAIHQYKVCPGGYFLGYVDPERKLISYTGDMTATLPGKVSHTVVDRALKVEDKKTCVVTRVDETTFFDNKLFFAVFKEEASKKGISFFKRTGEEDSHLDWAESEQTAFRHTRELLTNLYEGLKSNDLFAPFMVREWNFGTYKNPFTINDQLLLSGAIDLMSGLEASAALRLLDYKGARSDYHLDKDQLKLYNIVAKAFGYNIGMCGFLLFRVRRKVIYERFGKQELDDTTEKFVSISKKIQREEFDFTPSKTACRFCRMRPECSKAFVDEGSPIKPKATPIATQKWDIPEL